MEGIPLVFILSLQCGRLQYELRDADGTPEELPDDARGPWSFTDCQFLTVGFERGDGDPRVLAEAAKQLRRIGNKTGARIVVINTFSKLADTKLRACAEEALAAANALQARLASNPRRPVHRMPFGWTKTFQIMDIASGPYAQTTMEVRPGRAPTRSNGDQPGLRQIRTVDGQLVPAAR
jgi:hypothetical protein